MSEIKTHKIWQLFGLCLLLGTGLPPAHADFYIYQAPDGSRVVRDRPSTDKNLKLIKSSNQVQTLGKLAISGYQLNTKRTDKRFEALINQMADRHDVDVALVKAVIRAESYFNPNATSRVGASGLMQLMPKTARRYGVTDLYSPTQNIEAGIRHLKYLLQRYPNRLHLAIAAYNAGENAVDRYDGIPPYRETRDYVKKVLKFHTQYLSKY